MKRSVGALLLVASVAAGLVLDATGSIEASPAATAAKTKRCGGHRYRHRLPPSCAGRRPHPPKPTKAKPKPSPRPSRTGPSGGSGGGSGGGATPPAPTSPSTPAAPAAGTSPGGEAPAPVGLPRRLGVDETEYSVTPSYDPVAAGDVELNVTNFGMDDHDLAIRSPGGRLVEVVDVPAGQSRSFSVSLPAGTYTLLCSLYDHEQLGMRATLRVQ